MLYSFPLILALGKLIKRVISNMVFGKTRTCFDSNSDIILMSLNVVNSRYDISDVYLGLCKVIGSSAVLEILAARLDKQLRIFRETNGNGSTDGETGLYVGTWQGVEATMYAIKSIGRYVPPDEARVLPVLMNREVRYSTSFETLMC